MPKHFLSITDLNKDQLKAVLQLSDQIEATPEAYRHTLAGKNVLFCFEKPSFRTLVGTEAGLNNCGAHVIHMNPEAFLGGNIVHAYQDLGQREALQDTISIAGHYCDALFLRVYKHETLIAVAEYAGVPVINALCDLEHPCQALADLYTILNHFQTDQPLTITFCGDATNVAFSLAQISLIWGYNFIWSGPAAYGFKQTQVAELQKLAAQYGGKLKFEPNIQDAVRTAQVVVTDTFVSMGSESEATERLTDLAPYQVNTQLWQSVSQDAIFLHCLPAHRGQEVTAEIIDGPQSQVITEAKNRLVTARGLFTYLLNN